MVYFIEPESKMVSLQNLLSLEERLRAENTEAARLNQERMSIDNEVPFVRQGSGRRPGPRKIIQTYLLTIEFIHRRLSFVYNQV